MAAWYSFRWRQTALALGYTARRVEERSQERDAARDASQEMETRLAALQSDSHEIRERLQSWGEAEY